MSSKNNIPLAKQEVRRNRSTASTVLSDSTAHRIEEGIVLSPPTSSSPLSSDTNEASPSTAKCPSSDCPSRKIIITVLLLSTLAIIVGDVSIYATSNKDSSDAESQQEDFPTVINDDDSTSVELLEDATVDYDTAIDDVSEETGEVVIPTADNSNPSSPLFFDPSPDNDEPMNDQDNNMLLIDTTSSPSLSPITDPPSTLSPTTFNPTSASPTSATPTSASPTSASPTSASPTEEPIIYDTIIIGAGWSGLRAAKVLSDSGANVLILEANDYIGGRSKTVMTKNNIPTDLGSEWLYANWNNKAPELIDAGLLGRATENDLNTVVHGEGSLYYSQLVVNDDDGETGGKVAMLIEDGYKIQSSLWKEFMNYKKEILKDQDDISYQDLLDMFLIVNSFTNEEEQLLHLLFDMGETEYSGEVDEMSVKELPFWFMEGGEMEDAYYMAVPDVGFGNTAIAYADGIDAEFKINSKVTDVNYEEDDNNGKVIISYEENGRKRKAEAKTALVTVSLGVLQAKTISFTPKLPDSKANAIDNMGFGDMNKVVLYWDSEDAIVWPDEYWFELITPEDETSGMYTTWYNPSSLKGVPCLVGWISGDEAESIEIETDEVIKEKAMDHLKSMFPSISEPDTVIISRWGQEEHVRGAYSFNRVGRNFADDAETLKEPVNNVWFAGEAMGGVWHATTIGAWQSGEEAADDMISSVLKKRF